MLQMGKKLYNQSGILCVASPNILTMGIWVGTMKGLYRTLRACYQIDKTFIKIALRIICLNISGTLLYTLTFYFRI